MIRKAAVLLLAAVMSPQSLLAESAESAEQAPDSLTQPSYLLSENTPHSGQDGWQVSLGLTLSLRDGFLYVGEADDEGGLGLEEFVDIRYQNERFFLALSPRDFSTGYTLWQENNWAFDAVLSPKQTGFDEDNEALANQDVQDIDIHLGGRLTGYGQHSSVALELSNDISGEHNSYIASVSYLREWPLKRWLISSQVSLSYLSADVTQHYYGVDANEANARFAAYEPGGATILQADLRADYPLSEHWVFRALINTSHVSGELKDSPIVDDALQTDYEMSVFYVF